MIETIFGAKRSLRRGLVVNIVVALLLCIAIAVSVLIKEFFEHLEENMEAALAGEATELIGQIDPSLNNYGFDPEALRFRGVDGAYRYTVFDATRTAIVGGETSEDIRAQLATLTLGRPTAISLPSLRVGLALKARVQNQDVFALVTTFPPGQDQSALQKILHEVREGVGWVILGIFLVVGSALLATQRVLTPIQNLSAQAEKIGPLAASQRLELDHVPTEIAPLVNSVNAAFERLEDGYRAQRDFSSNVAHEIRTPLAVLRSSVERISDPDVKAALEQDVLHLDQVFGQLIELARADAALKSNFVAVDLHQIAVDVASEAAPLAIGQGRSLSIRGAPKVLVQGNAGLLSEALANLTQNALAYSPEGTNVEIEVLEHPAGWRVLDRGPGVPDAFKQTLFERFNRGAQANSNTAGSGLGLAIVKSVAKSHGAVVNIADRDGGGSVFSFEFTQA